MLREDVGGGYGVADLSAPENTYSVLRYST